MYRFEVGGCESVFLELARCMTSKIELVTVIPQINPKLAAKVPPNVKIVRHSDLPILNMLSKLKGSRMCGVLYSLISMMILPLVLKKKHKGEDVTYINFSDTLSSLRVAVTAGKNKAISWLQCRPRELVNSRSYSRYIKYMRRCRKIVCICKSQKEEFIEMHRDFDGASFAVIYNPIDRVRITTLKDEPVAVDASAPYICMVSRLDERSKDFYTAIDAYSMLSEELKDKYSLRIIGDGPDREKIEEYVNDKRLTSNVFIQGSDTNPYKWMAQSEVFLFSSKNEGLGLVILEALACGKIVIATDCPVGPAEILKDNTDCGMLVPVGDAEAMAGCLTEVLTGKTDKNAYLKNAKKRLDEFSIQSFKKKLSDLFSEKSV